MSPEQIREQILTHQTDIYSLAVTMYKLLTGKLPFDARNNYSMIYQIVNIEPPPAQYLPPGNSARAGQDRDAGDAQRYRSALSDLGMSLRAIWWAFSATRACRRKKKLIRKSLIPCARSRFSKTLAMSSCGSSAYQRMAHSKKGRDRLQ